MLIQLSVPIPMAIGFYKTPGHGKHETTFRGDIVSTNNNATAESLSFPFRLNYNATYKIMIK